MDRKTLIQRYLTALQDLGIETIWLSAAGKSVLMEEANRRKTALAVLAKEIAKCKKCRYLQGRLNAVPGQGNPMAKLCFVGEAPGEDEDKQGLAFVGRAGQLLTELIQSIGLTRSEVFICNVLKCRPPNNRLPLPEEVENCMPFLIKQLDIIRPKLICCLGHPATVNLLGLSPKTQMGQVRGKFFHYQDSKVFVTYHPSYVLRSPAQRPVIFEDFKRLRQEYDRLIG